MDKKIVIIFMLFFIFILLFIGIIFISENKNMHELRENYGDISDKAFLYRKTNLKIWAIKLVLSFLIPTLFLFTGLSSRIRDFAQGKSQRIFFIIVVYVIIYTFIDFLINLPLDYYGNFIVEHRFGLSNQSFFRWTEVTLKSFILNLVIYAAFLWFPFYIINRSPNRWWFYLGLISIPVYLFASFISPMYIDPIFNKYTAVEDKELEKEIKVLLKKADIEGAQIYQVDKSRDTKEMNAYMTGVFSSRRIVLWDTTIKNLTKQEVLNVTAHEIGHYVKGHIWKLIVLGGISTIFLLFLVDKTSLFILQGSRGGFGFKNLYDIAALPLLILMLNLYIFLGSPILNGYSRHAEREADTFELELTRNREATASSLIKLHEESLAMPRPSKIFEFWYYSHPSCEERVNFALNYKFKGKLP